MANNHFNDVQYNLSSLMDQIDMGSLALPDIQRPFVWKNDRVRDLFDSMYRGYPVGSFLFWKTSNENNVRQIGDSSKALASNLLIIDGQQRLTSLYAVTKGIEVLDDAYNKRSIKIAFKPETEKFAVLDAAIDKSAEYLSDISVLWSKDTNILTVVRDFTASLRESREKSGDVLTDAQVKKVEDAILSLSNLANYSFTVTELLPSLQEDQVAEIFVRVNSKGKQLTQSDFILTLLSVYWEEGRRELETFCMNATKPPEKGKSPWNVLIKPDASLLVRVIVGYEFRRARLKYAYQLLCGNPLTRGKAVHENATDKNARRDEQFDIFKSAQATVLDLGNWQDFLAAIRQSGFRSGKMISSDTGLMFCYVMYLIAKYDYDLKGYPLHRLIGRWHYMATLTSRYTNSTESRMEEDFSNLRDIDNREDFVAHITKTIDGQFTHDFWNTNLPEMLNTSSASTPVLFTYYAALSLANAPVMYSTKTVKDALDSWLVGGNRLVDRHHIFPKGYLEKQAIASQRQQNQVANYALVEWHDNIIISDKSPSDYAPEYEARFSKENTTQMYKWHAMPDNWHQMSYEAFISARRQMIADIIREGYLLLTDEAPAALDESPDIAELIANGETAHVEFKQTLRRNIHTKENDPRMEHSCLKTLCAFLNSQGGTLLIGVADNSEVIGIEADSFANADRMDLHLSSLIRDRMGAAHNLNMIRWIEELDGKQVMVIHCKPSQRAVYLKEQNREVFYSRESGSTNELMVSELQHYLNERFGNRMTA